MNNEVTGIAGEPDIFDLTAASFPNYDHIEDILEMIPDLVAAVFTSLFGFFDNTKKMPVYEQSHAIYAQFDNFRYFINEVKFNEIYEFDDSCGNTRIGNINAMTNTFSVFIILCCLGLPNGLVRQQGFNL